MSLIVSSQVCRPTQSGEVIVLCSAKLDLPKHGESSSTSFEAVDPPSDLDIAKIVRQRVKTHFNNNGKIEMDRFVLYYLVTIELGCPLILCCIAEPACDRAIANKFLGKTQSDICQDEPTLSAASTSGHMQLQQAVGPLLVSNMMETNAAQPNTQDTRIKELRAQVDDVKQVMAANVEAILERGERLDSIQRRTDELNANSANFKMTARRVQRKMCMMNAKWTIVSVVVGLIILAIIILLILKAAKVI
ncbi:hypothetical protein WR25_12277 [Diploscapter pachys]|uniref:Vesicle-associated membrane protein 7 n=1 Tax=Diploscapter pachys TaxID=2018661 RepID=A0A2A2JV53_9BILA|nr:hypothetical protein WR25_12277 [Diploscapter pachys]